MLIDSRNNVNTLNFSGKRLKDPLFWLGDGEYRTYNIDIARKLKSLHAAILIKELKDKWYYHFKNNELINDKIHGNGWFYETCEKIEERTYLSRKYQDSALNILEKLGLVEKKVFGLPPKRHFRLNIEKINAYLLDIEDENKNISTNLSDRTNLIVSSDKSNCPIGQIPNIVINTNNDHPPQVPKEEEDDDFFEGMKERVGEKIFEEAMKRFTERMEREGHVSHARNYFKEICENLKIQDKIYQVEKEKDKNRKRKIREKEEANQKKIQEEIDYKKNKKSAEAAAEYLKKNFEIPIEITPDMMHIKKEGKDLFISLRDSCKNFSHELHKIFPWDPYWKRS